MIFRFPDLYDTDYSSSGLGPYCLMAAGSHQNNGFSPCGPNSFLRERSGWYEDKGLVELKVQTGQIVIPHNYRKVFKYTPDPVNAPNEFFVLENRLRSGNDSYLPSEGLAVYHVDTDKNSNDNELGTSRSHYLCALIQADGLRQLEGHAFERGDLKDLFGVGSILSDATKPSTRLWNGKESGLNIRVDSFDLINKTITITLNPNAGGGGGKKVYNAVKVPEKIPDAFVSGIQNTIFVSDWGLCRIAQVTIDIKHGYSGDLSISLISPSGKKKVIQTKSSNSSQFAKIQSLDVSSMFSSTEIHGTWVLNVADEEKADLGELVAWSLLLEFQ
jgi:hypothetical protein